MSRNKLASVTYFTMEKDTKKRGALRDAETALEAADTPVTELCTIQKQLLDKFSRLESIQEIVAQAPGFGELGSHKRNICRFPGAACGILLARVRSARLGEEPFRGRLCS